MVNEFCGFKHGVIGTDKMPADTTLNNMKKADLIKLLHTAQHNYETLMWFYNNAVKANMAQLNNNGWIPCSERLPEFVRNNLKACKVYEPKKKKTNADRIRSMSDEELAEWLTKITDDAQLDARTKCNYQWKDWLQSEAE